MKQPIELVQNFYTSVTSDTILSIELNNLTIGNTLLCAFVVRSDIVSISDGWEIIGGGEQTLNNAQKLYFCKKVITNSTETFTVTQTSSGRSYIVVGEFSGIKNTVYDSTMSKLGTGNYTVTGTKSEGSAVFYGVHSYYYSTIKSEYGQTCSPDDLVKLEGADTGVQERLACWFDNGNGEITHTFKICNQSSTSDHIAEVNGVYLIPFETKYLIAEGETVYSFNSTELTSTELSYSTLTGDDFSSFGFDEITTELCEILKSHTTFKILYWQEDIETAVPLFTATVTGVPTENQTLIFDVDLTQAVSTIKSVESVFNGSPLLAFSIDEGVSWSGYDEINGWADGDMYLSNVHLLTETVMSELIGENTNFKVRITLTEDSEFTSLKFVYEEV